MYQNNGYHRRRRSLVWLRRITKYLFSDPYFFRISHFLCAALDVWWGVWGRNASSPAKCDTKCCLYSSHGCDYMYSAVMSAEACLALCWDYIIIKHRYWNVGKEFEGLKFDWSSADGWHVQCMCVRGLWNIPSPCSVSSQLFEVLGTISAHSSHL
jgi:hypothetical protein